MIYIKNIGEVQTIYIPRNELLSETYVVTNKNCEYCYNEGLNDGIGKQKDKLTVLSVSENGLYEREDGWHTVDVNIKCKADNKQEKNITITQEFETVLPDEGYDSLSKVDINASEYGNQKHLEGYNTGKVEGAEEGYTQGKKDGYDEGYDIGKVDGYNEGYNTGKVDGREDVYLIGFESTPSWEKRDENNRVKYNASESGADGFSSVTIDIGTVYEEGHLLGKTEGYETGYDSGYEEGITEQKSKLENIEITVNGTYTKEDGYGSVVVKVPDVNGSYDEGYTNGISEQKAKLTNLTVTENGTYSNTDGWNSVSVSVSQTNIKTQTKTLVVTKDSEVVVPDSNYDGLSKVTVNASQYGQTKRNEGYEEGYERGVSAQQIYMRNGTKFAYSTFTSVPASSWNGVKDMSFMFYMCENLTTIPSIDTSSVTTMYNAFYGCKNIETISPLDTSNVTNIQGAFYACVKLIDIPEIDTSSVTNMDMLFYGCTGLNRIPALDCSKVTSIDNFFGNYTITNLFDLGGFINLKRSMTTFGLEKAPNLSYTACINVLNGLYDFTGNGVKPTVNEGRLKVHQNFLDLVGDNISIATNRGWIITA
jgi:surface protein